MTTKRNKRRVKTDPRAILEKIAADVGMAAYVRVAACRALLTQPADRPTEAEKSATVQADITAAALKILNKGRR